MGSVAHTKPAHELPLGTLVSLLAGRDFWHTPENNHLGLGSVRFSDGPNGVRGEDWVNGPPSAAIPCATALGASFDENLVRRLAALLAAECKQKGVHALLAPTMNIHRYATCGRNFESFSEDPFLTGVLATAYVHGVQGEGIAACPKHFLANEAENGRRWSDSIIEERALREIYLEPFRMVVQNASPWALMTAYNSVNGAFCSESAPLLSILKNEWNFSGVVVSDWFGTYSSAPAINAGLDLELPGPSKFRTEDIVRKALGQGEVSQEQLNASVERVLRFLERTGRVGPPGSAPPIQLEPTLQADGVDDGEVQRLLTEAARATMVLLKNERQTMPIDQAASPRIRVFGEHAQRPSLFGGGSASLKVPSDTPSPWDMIRQRFPDAAYSGGVATERLVKTPRGGHLHLGPISLRWYNGHQIVPSKEFHSETIADTLYMLVEDAPDGLVDRSDFCTAMTFTFTPPASAHYDMSIAGPGNATCTVGGKVVMYVRRDLQVSTEDFLFDRSKLEVRLAEPLFLQRGVSYEFEVRSWSSKHKAANVNREFFIQGCRLGFGLATDDDAALAQSRAEAAEADVAVVFVGTGPEWESEGFDRVNMQLPQRQSDLVQTVASACPGRTIVVVNAGSPIDMSSWFGSVDAVVQAWFPGMGFAAAFLDLLVGDFNPCARLPTSFWDKVDDYPAGHVESLMDKNKGILYREGVHVGYRQPSSRLPPPRFAFGHGLSYTDFHHRVKGHRWAVTDLKVPLEVQVDLTNTGRRAGRATTLLFLQPLSGRDGTFRPEVELKAFGKSGLIGGGETETITLTLDKRSFAYWDCDERGWRVNEGQYLVLFAGPLGVGDWKAVGQRVISVTRSIVFRD